jgi:hypothetical protein
MHDSLSRYPESLEFAQRLSEHAIDIDSGLRAHHELLLQVYKDFASISAMLEITC